MTATELLEFLREFYRDKLTIRQTHVAAARAIADYNANNTYQYVIAREDMQLTWLLDAITGMGGVVETVSEPAILPSGKGAQAAASLFKADCDAAQRFVDSWRPRLEAMPNARHRSMLGVIIGEALEHKRFFEQALAGRDDLLGRRADGAGTGDGVLPVRWIER